MRFNDLQSWLDWQLSLHAKSIDMGLARTAKVYAELACGKPAPVVISVAGTNGKGSTVAMLNAILLAGGYKVGCFTSPHILRYNERVRINDQQVSDQSLCQAFEAIDQARGDTSLTYFEFGTLAALYLFAEADLDVVVLETGLGGRLDAINIIDADVAVVTSIGLDHTDWLGDTRELIALEKMGIGRAHKPLIVGDPQPPQTLLDGAAAQEMDLQLIGRDYGFQQDGSHWSWWSLHGGKRFSLPMPALRGLHQLYNASSVLQAMSMVQAQLPVSQANVREGLENVVLAGRFQIHTGRFRTVTDVAHNPQAAVGLASNLAKLPPVGETHAILGMLADKAIAETLQPLLSRIDVWHLCTLDVDRGCDAATLREHLLSLGVSSENMYCYDAVSNAQQHCQESLKDDDTLLIFGSFFTVSQFHEGFI
jgi:dihydrofolate synthase/folylpolyglutamate synthase